MNPDITMQNECFMVYSNQPVYRSVYVPVCIQNTSFLSKHWQGYRVTFNDSSSFVLFRNCIEIRWKDTASDLQLHRQKSCRN